MINQNARITGEAATAASPLSNSGELKLEGSAWDGSTNDESTFNIRNVVTGVNQGGLSIFDELNLELLFLDRNGTLKLPLYSAGSLSTNGSGEVVVDPLLLNESNLTAANGATTVIAMDGSISVDIEVADITSAGTIIELPNPSTALNETTIFIKFSDIAAGQSATITTSGGGVVIEDITTGLSSSITVTDTQDRVGFTFKISHDGTYYKQL